jgi:hypothetical protein
MGDVLAFVIKGDAHTFIMGEEMGGAPAFMMKGDASLATRISFSFIIEDAH